MKKVIILSLASIFVITGISFGSNSMVNRIPDGRILIDSGIPSWVPNPLVGTHKWKKVFSDEKYLSSKKTEFMWHYDSKTSIKATAEKLNFKGQPLELKGATLVWVKVVGSKTNKIMFPFYALWPEKRVALFFWHL